MTISPSNPSNAYEILGIKPIFSISQDQVQRAYLQKLSTTHPDLVSQESNSSPDQLDPAALNQARDTLLNDESRANLMLALINGPSPKDTTLPDNFLMDMMQLRTQIEEELEADPAEARPRWQSWANQERIKTIQTIADLFNELESPTADALAIKQHIRTCLNAHRYTQRLIEQLDPTYHPSVADF